MGNIIENFAESRFCIHINEQRIKNAQKQNGPIDNYSQNFFEEIFRIFRILLYLLSSISCQIANKICISRVFIIIIYKTFTIFKLNTTIITTFEINFYIKFFMDSLKFFPFKVFKGF